MSGKYGPKGMRANPAPENPMPPSRPLSRHWKLPPHDPGAWVLIAMWMFGAVVVVIAGGEWWHAVFCLFIAWIIETQTRRPA